MLIATVQVIITTSIFASMLRTLGIAAEVFSKVCHYRGNSDYRDCVKCRYYRRDRLFRI